MSSGLQMDSQKSENPKKKPKGQPGNFTQTVPASLPSLLATSQMVSLSLPVSIGTRAQIIGSIRELTGTGQGQSSLINKAQPLIFQTPLLLVESSSPIFALLEKDSTFLVVLHCGAIQSYTCTTQPSNLATQCKDSLAEWSKAPDLGSAPDLKKFRYGSNDARINSMECRLGIERTPKSQKTAKTSQSDSQTSPEYRSWFMTIVWPVEKLRRNALLSVLEGWAQADADNEVVTDEEIVLAPRTGEVGESSTARDDSEDVAPRRRRDT
ncbi:hypothetical protein JCGZ_27170 [Jatropha curcas]|uniref:Uncharacterized protein n=1 Tax=Jatropha curcas TaxID=180498 RepID=A0A067JJ07_JATCU|nr:hypothetical protein JCGZ_27170 [Jatropha curcas]